MRSFCLKGSTPRFVLHHSHSLSLLGCVRSVPVARVGCAAPSAPGASAAAPAPCPAAYALACARFLPTRRTLLPCILPFEVQTSLPSSSPSTAAAAAAARRAATTRTILTPLLTSSRHSSLPKRPFHTSRHPKMTSEASTSAGPDHSAPQRSPSPDASTSTPYLKYISAQEAAAIDEHLMSPSGSGYLLPQLMELAGLSCAQALYRSYPPDVFPELLIAAGPGNQGGDGLVAARHAKLWEYNVKVWYPKQGKAEIFQVSRTAHVVLCI